MTDASGDETEVEVSTEWDESDTESEYVECEKGQIIFPHGTARYADTHGFNALFVEYKTGAITGEDAETGAMRSPERKCGNVTAIK